MKRNPDVDSYIARAQGFAQPILSHVRELCHRALPDGEEVLKWGVPYYTVNGKKAVGMAAFKQHASVIVCGDETAGGGMGNFGKIKSLGDLPDDEELIARFQKSAKDVQISGRKKCKPKPVLETPDDLATALDSVAGAREIYDGFTDAQRRDYIEWVTSAKREATRQKRIETATQWIGEGKRRNWKYEKC